MAHLNHNFGLTCSPSKITKTKEFDVTEILVSYGGGMGHK